MRRRGADGVRVARTGSRTSRPTTPTSAAAGRSAPELLDELVERYRRLGIDDENTASPLNAVTEETRAALEQTLALPVYTGMRHWQPRIATPSSARSADGAEVVVGLVLAPHWSTLSIAKLRGAVRGGGRRPRRDALRRAWGAEPGFVALLAERVRVARTPTSSSPRIRCRRASWTTGDPYEDELLETSRLVAEAAGVGDWSFSYQSESPTGEPWLGPDILDHLDGLHDAGRRPACASVRSASSPTTSRSAGTSTSRRRSGRASSGSSSTGSRCRTPTPPSSTCSPPSSGGTPRYRRRYERARRGWGDPRRASRAFASAPAIRRR